MKTSPAVSRPPIAGADESGSNYRGPQSENIDAE